MKILSIQSTESGVYYHRQFIPHYHWVDSGDDHADDFVAIVETKHMDKIQHLINNHHFDIVQFSVGIVGVPDMDMFIPYMKRRGSKIVLDVDDRYDLKKRKDVKRAVETADAITTVSENLARYYFTYCKIKKYPYVIENGIDSEVDQFKHVPVDNDEVVFGYLGSTRHEADLLSMRYDFYDNKLFTVCKEYSDLLCVDKCSGLKNYFEYAWEYNGIDVALAPLVPNPFNEGKSFLKVIEAGFKKKAIICTDTEPYNRNIHSEFKGVIDLIPYGTSWEQRVKSYSLTEAKEKGERLFELVQPFEIKNLNKKRREIYQWIIEKH